MMVKDPVCGMMVDSRVPPVRIHYQGKEYFFCSTKCREDFEKDPEKYLSKSEEEKDS